jgi:phosphoribosylaminoimidazole-succinocarboxamide synthase
MNIINELKDLKLIRQGKVRCVYDIGEHLLIVATDNISAFDVIMNELIPNKGKLLTKISLYWFLNSTHIIKNHLIEYNVEKYPTELLKYKDVIVGRSMIVKKCEPLPIEFVVRGYLAGSGWKEYQQSQTVCGISLPAGLKEYSKLPNPIFTPASKNYEGHDENINFEKYKEIIGDELANSLMQRAIELYKYGSSSMEERGIILADTKFEFGKDSNGEIILIDEALTPDSSRFWLKENYKEGVEQTNFDKQVLRDWLETLDWDKNPPPPALPTEIIEKTLSKYKQAAKIITGDDLV